MCNLSRFRQYLFICLIWFFLVVAPAAQADVVKPALIEIKADTTGVVMVEIRASIEALLTGINSRFRDTTEAPNAEAYDELRVLLPEDLTGKFETFKPEFLQGIRLEADGKALELRYSDIRIPEVGYSKVPRISVITLTSKLSRSTEALRWYYPASFGENAVRVRQIDSANEKWHWSSWQWIREDKASELFSLSRLFTKKSVWEVAASYIQIGFDHIIPLGLDHILFILGLFLLSARLKLLLWQVTMFTVAHTITLGLSMNGLIELSPRIVEPLIALSIAYIGIENLFTRQLKASRLILVFAFGLLHGMGFAGALSDFGMPQEDFAVALISFNVGVELGQIAVISLAYIAITFWLRNQPAIYRKFVVNPASLAIGLLGLYWAFDRIQIA